MTHLTTITRALPLTSVCLLLIIDLFTLSGAYPAPFLGLIAMIYWGIYRPDLTKIYLVVLLGIMIDVIQGQGAWIHAFVFLVINLIATSQFKFFYRKPFYLIWAGVSLIVLFYYLMISAYTIFFTHASIQLLPLVSSIVMTSAFIPVVFRMMIYLHEMLHERV